MILWAILFWLAFNPRIERGYTLDINGNGICVDFNDNPVDEVYNYVAYDTSIPKGTCIYTFYLYDPKRIGRHEDDIIFRHDFVTENVTDVSRYEPYTNRLYSETATIILQDGNVYDASVLLDNKGTETQIDDIFESIW